MIELKIDTVDGKIQTVYSANGSTNALLDELASGAVAVLMSIADDMNVKDPIHEPMASVLCSCIESGVARALAARDGQAGPAGEDA